MTQTSSKVAHGLRSATDLLRRRRNPGSAYDELTGLPSRGMVGKILEGMLERCDADQHVAVVFLDLDDFKLVNDSLGHQTGDAVLCAVAGLLGAVRISGDVLGRFSGDEFVVCCPGIVSPGQVDELLARLTDVLRVPFRHGDDEVTVCFSAGVALSGPGRTAESLLADAEAAMYRAKEEGGGAHTWFEEELRTRARRRLELEAALRRAIVGHELEVHYQPKVRLADGVIVGAEALVRWDRPGEGLVPPDEFIAVAERSDLVLALGKLVLGTACHDAARWRHNAPERSLTVAVNVSARQLQDASFVSVVRDALEASGVNPAALLLELTETSVMRDPAAATDVLHDLKALGVTLSIDDFGTGNSSLAYLRNFPIDQVKIDRSFVADVERSPDDRNIIAAIIAIADALGLDLVAEGVETDAQLAVLAELGCEVAQGFLWAPALPSPDFEVRLGRPEVMPDFGGRGGAPARGEDSAGGPVADALASIEHELRGPLGVVLGWGELLADGAADGIAAGPVIMRNVDRIISTLDMLTGVGEVAAGTVALHREPVDLAALVAELATEMTLFFAGADVEVATAGAPVIAHVDPQRVEQILLNLISNARRFSPSGEPVVVTVRAQSSGVEVVVADRGAGVPDDQVGLIFRKFGKAHRERGSHTGLGLYLARGLARAHGGDVRYHHRPGGGAEFTLTVPRAEGRRRG